MIALLDGRDGEPLKEWTKPHDKIRLSARDRASAYASAISGILPDCVQVADRFHLLQNLPGYMKDIFREKMPSKIYIQDGKVLEKEPEDSFLESLHYDNTPPMDSSGDVAVYDNKKHDLNSEQYRHQEEKRKKITVDQEYTGLLERAGRAPDKKCGRDLLFLYQAPA